MCNLRWDVATPGGTSKNLLLVPALGSAFGPSSLKRLPFCSSHRPLNTRHVIFEFVVIISVLQSTSAVRGIEKHITCMMNDARSFPSPSKRWTAIIGSHGIHEVTILTRTQQVGCVITILYVSSYCFWHGKAFYMYCFLVCMSLLFACNYMKNQFALPCALVPNWRTACDNEVKVLKDSANTWEWACDKHRSKIQM